MKIVLISMLISCSWLFAAHPSLPKIDSAFHDMNTFFGAVKESVQSSPAPQLSAKDCASVKDLEKSATELFTLIDAIKTDNKKLAFKLSLFRLLVGVFVEDISPLSANCDDGASALGAKKLHDILANLNTEISKMNERYPELRDLLRK